jgi:hypothetical protein
MKNSMGQARKHDMLQADNGSITAFAVVVLATLGSLFNHFVYG